MHWYSRTKGFRLRIPHTYVRRSKNSDMRVQSGYDAILIALTDMQTIVYFLCFCSYPGNIFLRSRSIGKSFQIFFNRFYSPDVRRDLNETIIQGPMAGVPAMLTFSVLTFSSSTLVCNAAEASWYSSNKWYAAKDEAKEKPKRKPMMLIKNDVNIGKNNGNNSVPSTKPTNGFLLNLSYPKV